MRVNMQLQIGKGNKTELKNGDTIHLLHSSKVAAGGSFLNKLLALTALNIEIMGYVFCTTVNLEEIANKRKKDEQALEAFKKEQEQQAVQKKVAILYNF